MRVLRVETGEGRGMYSSGESGCWAELAGMEATADDRHPMPYNDSLYARNEEAAGCPDFLGRVFGFLHEEQLRAWLYDDRVRTKLKQLGLKLSVYEVPESAVIVGYTQLTFGKGYAELIGELDLVTLEPI